MSGEQQKIGFKRGARAIEEMKEFASFASGTQRYIRRSLAVAKDSDGAMQLWSRDDIERVNIRVQAKIYDRLSGIRDRLPENSGLEWIEPFMVPLVTMTAFDLAQDRLPGFSAYRFLYERLIGAEARPWLPGAFCAAAALPHIAPEKRRGLLQSLSENAATARGWSAREPSFFPDWVDKDEEGMRLSN